MSRNKELNGSVPSHTARDETTGEAEVSWGLQQTRERCLMFDVVQKPLSEDAIECISVYLMEAL